MADARFIGFDQPAQNENFFELARDGKPYVSLYHDCRVTELVYPEDGNFVIYLNKVHDSGHGPSVGSNLKFVLTHADITSVRATMDGNFEDVEEVVWLGEEADKQLVNIVVSGVQFSILCTQVILDDTVHA